MAGSHTSDRDAVTPGRPSAGAPGEPVIVFDHVSRVFGGKKGAGVKAVDDVSLAVNRGEVFGVIGFSGAGKSTLIRMINGLEKPTSGTVTVLGQQVSHLSEAKLRPLRTRIGMVFQQFNLLTSRTVAGNIEFALDTAGWPRSKRRARVAELLEFVGLADKAKHYPEQLSGGQKQRVGIARALAAEPEILLADEATSALDPSTTHEVLSVLRRVNEELGVTIVAITHEMEVVRSIAQQVSVLAAGHLVESGSARQVFTHPQSETTQRFLATIIGQHPSGEEQARLQSENPHARLVDVSSVASHSFGDALARISRTGASFQIVHGGVIEVHDGSLGNYTVALSGPAQAVEQAARILDEVSNSAAPTTSATVPTPTEEAH